MWQHFLFTITHDRACIVYCIKQEEYWICCVEDTYAGFLHSWQDFFVVTSGRIYSGAPAAEGCQAEPHTHIRELKGTHESIFSCVPWLAVLLVGAYARRRRRRRWSRATWRPYSNNRLTETCSLGLPCTSLISDIHVMIN